MRHRNKVKKMGRTSSHRAATLRNIAIAVFEHKQIRTTLAKAKAAQGYIEKLVTYGKTDSVHSRRLVFKFLQDHSLVKTLFDEIAPTYEGRPGGYTRIVKLGMRRGDSAPLAALQLVGFEKFTFEEEAKPKKKKHKAKPEKPTTAAVEETTVAEDEETKETAVEASEDIKAEEALPKEAEAGDAAIAEGDATDATAEDSDDSGDSAEEKKKDS